MCKWLCCYVQETKKENGQAYSTLSVDRLAEITIYIFLLMVMIVVENGSKNYQGRFSETDQANTIFYAHPNSREKCAMHILDLYLKKLPPGSTAFYMQPVQKLPADPYQVWFKSIPVGVNPLKNMMTKVSELAGLSVKYTNHSLRATLASRMFVSGVPEKIVAEVMGHKSV
ncbi:MAG: site-specific integrase, partial [Proteobacteria bacterium]|nr:site-specific integrase [Pseudomonadota bacterium]